MDLVGRLGPVDRGDGARIASYRSADACPRLRHHGALASLDGGAYHRSGNFSASPPTTGGSQRHLSTLLTPLHNQPENLAARLLYRFGSIARIAQATEAELRQICLVGENWVEAFVGIRQLIHDGMREKLFRTRLGTDRQTLLTYLLMTMRNLREERMVAIFADREGFVIAEEVLAEGGETHVALTPRKIFGRALNLDARQILLAHNHPSGWAEPSEQDVRLTQSLCRQADELGLSIEDHLIVGAREVVSMKERGLI